MNPISRLIGSLIVGAPNQSGMHRCVIGACALVALTAVGAAFAAAAGLLPGLALGDSVGLLGLATLVTALACKLLNQSYQPRQLDLSNQVLVLTCRMFQQRFLKDVGVVSRDDLGLIEVDTQIPGNIKSAIKRAQNEIWNITGTSWQNSLKILLNRAAIEGVLQQYEQAGLAVFGTNATFGIGSTSDENTLEGLVKRLDDVVEEESLSGRAEWAEDVLSELMDRVIKSEFDTKPALFSKAGSKLKKVCGGFTEPTTGGKLWLVELLVLAIKQEQSMRSNQSATTKLKRCVEQLFDSIAEEIEESNPNWRQIFDAADSQGRSFTSLLGKKLPDVNIYDAAATEALDRDPKTKSLFTYLANEVAIAVSENN